MKWIIDTDAGVDDAIAFAMPFAAPRWPTPFELIAATTVAGNCSLDKVNQNVSAVLKVLGQPTPVYIGCDRPLIEPYQDAADFHGGDGLGDAGLPVSTRPFESEHGALALTRIAREQAGHLGVIALGPLTNIALACNLDESFAKNVRTLVVMGGAWRAQGNQTSAAEFNIAVDPESARIVFDRFEKIVMLPWEVSLDRMYPFERLNALADAGTARADFYYRMTRMGVKDLSGKFKLSGFPLPDPLAVAVALDETLIKREIHAQVKIDIGRDVGRALTSLDLRSASPNTRVVVDMDFDRAFDMIDAGMRG